MSERTETVTISPGAGGTTFVYNSKGQNIAHYEHHTDAHRFVDENFTGPVECLRESCGTPKADA